MKYLAVSFFLHLLLIFRGLLAPEIDSSILPLDEPISIEISQALPQKATSRVSSARQLQKKKTIARLNSQKNTKVEEGLTNKKTVQASEPNVSSLTYVEELKLYLEENKHYPRQAIQLKQSGVVFIKLKISRNGMFEQVKIAKASSFPVLDTAAIKLLKKLREFKPLPQSIAVGTNFTIPISYVLKGG